MTVRFLADENFNRAVVAGVLRLVERADIELVQSVDLRTQDDPTILEWAAREGRVLLTHDISTMPDFAYERVAAGLPMPGVFILASTLPLSVAIEQIAVVAGASEPGEWENRVAYFPLR